MQPGLYIDRNYLIGKWSVYDVTQTFKDMELSELMKTLASLDAGITGFDRISNAESSSGAPSIDVEILATGEMRMAIVQSMQPGMPAAMNLNAVIKWQLSGDKMTTQAMIDTLAARIAIAANHHLPNKKFAELKKEISGIEASTLESLRRDPQWTNKNIVSIIYCGKRYFLTRSENGSLMLHQRNL
jgi:hypothetical protein